MQGLSGRAIDLKTAPADMGRLSFAGRRHRYAVANALTDIALTDIAAPRATNSPLTRHLPKLRKLIHHHGTTTVALARSA
jgi:hypothetical protein